MAWRIDGNLGEFLVSALLASALGVLLVLDARSVLIVLIPSLVVLAMRRPKLMITGTIAACGVYNGLYLYARASLAGVPLSIFDGLPVLLLLAAYSLRSRSGARARPTAVGRAAAGMLCVGLLLGALTGLLAGADRYQLIRVCRVEIDLLFGIAAALVAGGTPEWRDAVRKGLVVMGGLVALELLVGYVWLLHTGHTFWSLFPFGGDLQGGVYLNGVGDVNSLRTNAISGYLMLPSFVYVLMRLSRRNFWLLGLLIAGAAVTLSRGVWIAFFLATATVVVFRLCSQRLALLDIAKGLAAVLVVLTATYVLTGPVLAARWSQTSRLGSSAGLSADQSAAFRAAETHAALHALLASPLTALVGTGAGVVVYSGGISRFDAISPILENNLLARWTNLSLFSLIGTVLLLGGGFFRGWRLAMSGGHKYPPSLGLMGLALPGLLIAGLFGGTLMSPQNSLPLWLLAMTLLLRPAA
jgi:hypothetical protein